MDVKNITLQAYQTAYKDTWGPQAPDYLDGWPLVHSAKSMKRLLARKGPSLDLSAKERQDLLGNMSVMLDGIALCCILTGIPLTEVGQSAMDFRQRLKDQREKSAKGQNQEQGPMSVHAASMTISDYAAAYASCFFGPEDCLDGQGLKTLATEVAAAIDGKMPLTYEEVDAVISSTSPPGCLAAIRKEKLMATLALLLVTIVTRCHREGISLGRVADKAMEFRQREYDRKRGRGPAQG